MFSIAVNCLQLFVNGVFASCLDTSLRAHTLSVWIYRKSGNRFSNRFNYETAMFMDNDGTFDQMTAYAG